MSKAKTWVALVGALVTFASSYWSGAHWLTLVVGLLVALGVYQVPNQPVQ